MNVIGYYIFSLAWPNNSHLIKSWFINQKIIKNIIIILFICYTETLWLGVQAFCMQPYLLIQKNGINYVFIFRLRSTQTFWPRALFQDVFPFSKPNFNIKYFSIKYSFWKYDGCVLFFKKKNYECSKTIVKFFIIFQEWDYLSMFSVEKLIKIGLIARALDRLGCK